VPPPARRGGGEAAPPPAASNRSSPPPGFGLQKLVGEGGAIAMPHDNRAHRAAAPHGRERTHTLPCSR
jgi:hypothetical protein